jgi:hypothetical protein
MVRSREAAARSRDPSRRRVRDARAEAAPAEHGDEMNRIRRVGIWMAISLGVLAGCDSGPSGPPDAPGTTFNMSVDLAYFVQSIQTIYGSVPLIAGRDAYLRVFARANQANTVAPAVRVRFYHGGTLVNTIDAPFGAASLPTVISQATTADNWTIPIPGSLISAGLAVEVELDPDGLIEDANPTDNRYPSTAGPAPVDVRSVPPLQLRLVPIHQSVNDLTGEISTGNAEQYLAVLRKIFPISEIEYDVRAPFSVDTPALAPEPGVWAAVVSQLNALRVAEGTGAYYYGVARTTYTGGGVVGIATDVPSRASMGWDRFPDAPYTLAHELGHNFGRFHAPCGGAGGADPNYPYTSGFIGSYGMDVTTGEIKSPSGFTDIMGYCDASWWISDYTFRNILNHRASVGMASSGPAPKRESLIVWGRIVDGQPILEPAFRIATRPELPSRAGPYRIEGASAEGSPVFEISFTAGRAGDGPEDVRVFAFAVPLDDTGWSELSAIRLVANGRAVDLRAALPVGVDMPGPGPSLDSRAFSRGPDRIEAHWNAGVFPLAVVRDPLSGDILGFARDGVAVVPSSLSEVELILSNGVHSRNQRVTVIGSQSR